MSDEKVAFQDAYPDDVALCYGCGRLNEHGYQIKSYWDGDESVCHYVPEPYHTAIPGYVYGGLLASLVDCHSTGTAAAAAYRAAARDLGSEPALRFVTASLQVSYLRPTPLGPTLELRARVKTAVRRCLLPAPDLSWSERRVRRARGGWLETTREGETHRGWRGPGDLRPGGADGHRHPVDHDHERR